jgi:hypothetical protein
MIIVKGVKGVRRLTPKAPCYNDLRKPKQLYTFSYTFWRRGVKEVFDSVD